MCACSSLHACAAVLVACATVHSATHPTLHPTLHTCGMGQARGFGMGATHPLHYTHRQSHPIAHAHRAPGLGVLLPSHLEEDREA